ncbi:MAG TPA: YetF domain-containing protein [Verrucomicrobiae bacterium]|jgi:uncharacterized membrane protein YcaP (DUF421 family)
MTPYLEKIGDVLLGLNADAKDFHFYQIALRALITFFALLFMIRLAGRRILANRNPLDVLVIVLLASVLSRGVNGNTPLFSTLGAGFFLAALYRATAYLACRFHRLGDRLKGEAEILIKNGYVFKSILKRHNISQDDLMEDLRLNGEINELAEVKLAQLERNGAISVVKQPATAPGEPERPKAMPPSKFKPLRRRLFHTLR